MNMTQEILKELVSNVLNDCISCHQWRSAKDLSNKRYEYTSFYINKYYTYINIGNTSKVRICFGAHKHKIDASNPNFSKELKKMIYYYKSRNARRGWSRYAPLRQTC